MEKSIIVWEGIEIKKCEEFTDYGVDKFGNVYSFKFGQINKLNHRYNNKGYDQVELRKNGRGYKRLVSRLVLMTWNPIENPRAWEVDHKNEDHTDNRLENLQWMLKRDNLAKAGKVATTLDCWDLDGNYIGRFGSQYEACKELGLCQGAIYYQLKGKCKRTGNYIFKEVK